MKVFISTPVGEREIIFEADTADSGTHTLESICKAYHDLIAGIQEHPPQDNKSIHFHCPACGQRNVNRESTE